MVGENPHLTYLMIGYHLMINIFLDISSYPVILGQKLIVDGLVSCSWTSVYPMIPFIHGMLSWLSWLFQLGLMTKINNLHFCFISAFLVSC